MTIADIEKISSEIIDYAQAYAASYRLARPASISRGPSGTYLGNGVGSSIDFHDFREYQPGDDLRRVDWGAYARNDTLSIRLYQEELSPVVEVVYDNSLSMSYCPGKLAASVFCTAFIAAVTRRSEGRPVLLCGDHRFSGDEFESGLCSMKYEADSLRPHETVFRPTQGKPLRFIISDFLFPCDTERMMRQLVRGAASVFPVAVLAKCELDPDISGSLRLLDVEGGDSFRELRIDDHVISGYRKRLNNHLTAIEEAAVLTSNSLIRVNAEDEFSSLDDLAQRVSDQLGMQGVVEVV